LSRYAVGPIIGINQTPHVEEADFESIRHMAAAYVDRLQSVRPYGPYRLLGWSFGGVVAHEMAIELRRRGCEVDRLILLDAVLHGAGDIVRDEPLSESEAIEHIVSANRAATSIGSGPRTHGLATDAPLPPKRMVEFTVGAVNANRMLLQKHVPGVFEGDAVIFGARRSHEGPDSAHLQMWRPFITGRVTAHSVDCAHHEMLSNSSLKIYGEHLQLCLKTDAVS
jgi:thioesterase domain-containing protein